MAAAAAEPDLAEQPSPPAEAGPPREASSYTPPAWAGPPTGCASLLPMRALLCQTPQHMPQQPCVWPYL